MASNYGTTTQRTLSTNPNTSQNNNDDGFSKLNSTISKIHHFTFSIYFPFNIPSTPESAAIRIVKNLVKFSLYYAIFVWTVLFIALVPKRKVSIVYLVATTEVSFLYYLLLREFPKLHKIIDKRVVLFILFLVASIAMILTKAGIHLFVTLAATVPIVTLHAVLTKNEDTFVSDEDVNGEMASLVQEKLVDQNLV